MDDSEVSLLVLFDLSKAFDGVYHDLLLQKLVRLNIDSTLFESYFNETTHSVKIDKIVSDPYSSPFEVTQGSILGPILFNILSMPLLK